MPKVASTITATVDTNEASQMHLADQTGASEDSCEPATLFTKDGSSDKSLETTTVHCDKDPGSKKQVHVAAKQDAEHEKPQAVRTTIKLNESFPSVTSVVDRTDGNFNGALFENYDSESGNKEINTVVIGDHDVLSMSGRIVHAGNFEFLEYVRERKQNFKDATDKSTILREIQKLVTKSGGRFLYKDKSDEWSVMDQEKVMERIRSSMLRAIKKGGTKKPVHVNRKLQSHQGDRDPVTKGFPPDLQVHDTVNRAGAGTETKGQSCTQLIEVDVLMETEPCFECEKRPAKPSDDKTQQFVPAIAQLTNEPLPSLQPNAIDQQIASAEFCEHWIVLDSGVGQEPTCSTKDPAGKFQARGKIRLEARSTSIPNALPQSRIG
jgi:hypothetical protein